MSMRGLSEEMKQSFSPLKGLVIVGLLLILAGVIVLHYLRPGIPKTAVVSTNQMGDSEKILENLVKIRHEAEQMKAELNDRIQDMPTREISRIPKSHYVDARNRGRGVPFVETQPGQAFSVIKSGKEEVYIPMGSVFKARLLMPIKTSIQESFVMARTTHEFRMDAIRKIPKGSRLIGNARLNPVLKGVIVRFHTLVSPKGIEYPISLLALSPDLFPEVEGIYFSNQLETYSTILAFGFLDGFANAARDQGVSGLGVPYQKQNITNSLLGGASSASYRIAEDILEDVRRRAVEYVVVPASERIYVVFDKRFVLKDGRPISD